jgi:hypothetical protein
MTKAKQVLTTLIIVSGMWFCLTACTSSLPKDESIKHLKAFDAESLQLANKIGQSESVKALLALRQLTRLPLPMQSASSQQKTDASPYFSLDKNRGFYVYYGTDSYSKTLNDSSQAIIIRYPFSSRLDSMATFVLSAYSEETTAFEMTMPTLVQAEVKVAEHTIASLDFKAEMQHQMPQQAKLNFSFSGFSISCTLRTKFHSDYATIYIDYKLTDQQSVKLEGKVQSDVYLSEQKSLMFSNLQIEAQVFPVAIHFTADDQFSSQHQLDFPTYFNEHARFYFTDTEGNKLGDVLFMKVPGVDRISLSIRFSDGSEQNLEDLLLLVKNILNVKIPDAG